MSETTEQESKGRNPDGTFAPGWSGNPGGRPRNSLKDYVKRKLAEMSDEEKDEYLKTVDKGLIWQMAEGKPKQSIDGGEDEQGDPIPLLGGISTSNVLPNDSTNKDNQPQQEN